MPVADAAGVVAAVPGRGSYVGALGREPEGRCSDSLGARVKELLGEAEQGDSHYTPTLQRRKLPPEEMSNLVLGCCGPQRNSCRGGKKGLALSGKTNSFVTT